MLIVFYYHVEHYTDIQFPVVDMFYKPFFVNCFYFLSGYLIFRKQLSQPVINEKAVDYLSGSGKTMIVNALYRIAIPSILFATTEFLPKRIVRGESFDVNSFFVETIGGCTFWFTSALVVAELLLVILLCSRSNKIGFYFLCGVVLSGVGTYLKQHPLYLLGNENFPWAYANGLSAMAYLAFGGFFWKNEDKIEEIVRTLKKPIAIVISLTLFLFSIWLVQKCNGGLLTFAVKLVRDFIGVFFILYVCKAMPSKKWLEFIGRYSLGFYFLSGALPNITSVLINRVPAMPSGIVLGLVFALSVVSAYFVMKLLVRYFPWVFDLRLLRKED